MMDYWIETKLKEKKQPIIIIVMITDILHDVDLFSFSKYGKKKLRRENENENIYFCFLQSCIITSFWIEYPKLLLMMNEWWILIHSFIHSIGIWYFRFFFCYRGQLKCSIDHYYKRKMFWFVRKKIFWNCQLDFTIW